MNDIDVHLLVELKTAVGLILPTDRSLIALEQGKAIIPPNYTRCIQVRNASLEILF